MDNTSTLLLIPDDELNPVDIFSIAVGYANSAKMLQIHAEKEAIYLFPAMTCAAFSLELLAKYFVSLSVDKQKIKHEIRGHRINELWKKIESKFQNVVIGMHNNQTGKPLSDALEIRRVVFESALNELVLSGTSDHAQPFVDWRYPYELSEMKLMSLQPVLDVMETFGKAAQYIINQQKNHHLESEQ